MYTAVNNGLANFVYVQRLLKLASTKLNYIIGIGAILLYLDAVIIVLPSSDQFQASIYYQIVPCLTAIGYSLCYGTILAKMARVYYIFNNPTPSKKVYTCVWNLLLVQIIARLHCTVKPLIEDPLKKRTISSIMIVHLSPPRRRQSLSGISNLSLVERLHCIDTLCSA